jgi:uncharacterized protein (UPF0335 family)
LVSVKDVTGAIERILLPRLERLEGEIKALQADIRRLDDKIDTRLESLGKDIKAVDTRVEELAKRFDLVHKVSVLEVEVRDLKQKLSAKA